MDISVSVKRLHPEARLPEYQHEGDSGFDFYTLEEITIPPTHTAVIPTGLAMAIPEGYELQLRMRSGASLKTPLILPNAPATIDSGYRGEIGIIVRNVGPKAFTIGKGERIAQGVLNEVPHAVFMEVETLPETDRGSGGYGSTGNK